MSQSLASLANIFTFGFGNYQGVSTATGATAGTGVGLGIAAGSMLIDMGTAANKNTYPNPVVIGMTDSETNTAEDPFVSTYYDLITAYRQKEILCRTRKKRNADGFTCGQLNRQFMDVETRLETLESKRDDDIKAMIEVAKEAQE
jgi:hypothetical protein